MRMFWFPPYMLINFLKILILVVFGDIWIESDVLGLQKKPYLVKGIFAIMVQLWFPQLAREAVLRYRGRMSESIKRVDPQDYEPVCSNV